MGNAILIGTQKYVANDAGDIVVQKCREAVEIK